MGDLQNSTLGVWTAPTDIISSIPVRTRNSKAVRERYPSREVYLAQMTEATLALQRDGFLLPEDAAAILATVAERDFWSD